MRATIQAAAEQAIQDKLAAGYTLVDKRRAATGSIYLDFDSPVETFETEQATGRAVHPKHRDAFIARKSAEGVRDIRFGANGWAYWTVEETKSRRVCVRIADHAEASFRSWMVHENIIVR